MAKETNETSNFPWCMYVSTTFYLALKYTGYKSFVVRQTL